MWARGRGEDEEENGRRQNLWSPEFVLKLERHPLNKRDQDRPDSLVSLALISKQTRDDKL
jgi:hypothetical protein